MNLGCCENVVVKNWRVKNGYGEGYGINANMVGEPTRFYENIKFINCEVSHIYRFSQSQGGGLVDGLGINGNLYKNILIDRCIFYNLSPNATAIHFDVRSG